MWFWWQIIFWYFWANLILVSNFSEYEPSLRKIVRFSGLLLFGFCLIDLCNHRLSLFCYKMNIKWNQSRFYACLLWIKCNLPAQLNFSFLWTCTNMSHRRENYFKVLWPITFWVLLYWSLQSYSICHKMNNESKAEISEICLVIVVLLLIKCN